MRALIFALSATIPTMIPIEQDNLGNRNNPIPFFFCAKKCFRIDNVATDCEATALAAACVCMRFGAEHAARTLHVAGVRRVLLIGESIADEVDRAVAVVPATTAPGPASTCSQPVAAAVYRGAEPAAAARRSGTQPR